MENRKICLGHGKVMEFQIFPKTVFSYWLKSQKKKKEKEKKETLCQASKRSASGAFDSLFSPVL